MTTRTTSPSRERDPRRRCALPDHDRVRSDEGSPTRRAALQPAVEYPGVFVAFFQSKSPTVALANRIIFEEFDRIDELVTAEELGPPESFIETFPQNFIA